MVRSHIKIRFGIKMPKGIDWRRMCGPRQIHPSDKGLIVRLVNYGCANRPFYHINVEHYRLKPNREIPAVDILGSYDPMVNAYGEKLVAINLDRMAHYIGRGIKISNDVEQLLGLAGFLPISPLTYRLSWRNREELRYQIDLKEKKRQAWMEKQQKPIEEESEQQ